jgi:hypothetical protein
MFISGTLWNLLSFWPLNFFRIYFLPATKYTRLEVSFKLLLACSTGSHEALQRQKVDDDKKDLVIIDDLLPISQGACEDLG